MFFPAVPGHCPYTHTVIPYLGGWGTMGFRLESLGFGLPQLQYKLSCTGPGR